MHREQSIFTDIQTDSDNENGKWAGTHKHLSMQAAYNAWKEDPTIWNISFYPSKFHTDEIDRYEFRVKHNASNDKWHSQNESKLALLCPAYVQAEPIDVFWVGRISSPRNINLLHQQLQDDSITVAEFTLQFCLGCIDKVLTDVEFQAEYCI